MAPLAAAAAAAAAPALRARPPSPGPGRRPVPGPPPPPLRAPGSRAPRAGRGPDEDAADGLDRAAAARRERERGARLESKPKPGRRAACASRAEPSRRQEAARERAGSSAPAARASASSGSRAPAAQGSMGETPGFCASVTRKARTFYAVAFSRPRGPARPGGGGQWEAGTPPTEPEARQAGPRPAAEDRRRLTARAPAPAPLPAPLPAPAPAPPAPCPRPRAPRARRPRPRPGPLPARAPRRTPVVFPRRYHQALRSRRADPSPSLLPDVPAP